jgi:glutathione transport system substrate-binding protein
MKEAGYYNGFKVVFLTPNPSNRLRATEMVQQQLKEINITGEIQSMDIASFYNKLEAHRADDPNQAPFIGFGGWSSSTGDADWGIRPLLATQAFPPTLSNFGFFSDKKVDELSRPAWSRPTRPCAARPTPSARTPHGPWRHGAISSWIL